MSSIDSVLNSLTAVFTKDIYEPYISKKENTPLAKNMIFSVIFGILIILFVYLYLGDNTTSILSTIAAYVAPFGSLLTGIMICCIFIPSINDNGCFYGSIAVAIVSYYISLQLPSAHWLWIYFYGAVLCILFSWIASKLFKTTDEQKGRAQKYCIYGTIARVKGKTDDTGCSVEPLKMDKYGWIMIGILVVQCIILAVLQ
jgi:Sodium:solute symporter family.